MNRSQFSVLVYIERMAGKSFTQKEVAQVCGISVGTVNSAVSYLQEQKFIELNENGDYGVSELGYQNLEPYKVKRALFFAAGFGSRLVPVSYNTPKPLIRVKGVRMIDTLLDAVIEAGIEDITIVRGFLKEQFDTLLIKYPMIKFIDNDYYNEANNISSAYMARHLFENTLVLESDLLLSDPLIINKYEYSSSYKTKKVDVTDDWCFDTRGSLITKVKIGGVDTHQMVGISYWTKEDGIKLAEDIAAVYKSPGGKEKYWDEVALKDMKEKYAVNVVPVGQDAIIEIDTFAELCEVDPIYKVK
ncbi:MarR family transcriptional regulator [Erysipelothrix urinaevulpis]|uniref:MarR family transcriptional regulator n=1 Tax=Erysipelothrix urinaevulpis TaxID=2683717 RepID=UPI001356E21A|nr:MarR family transcriptional regulator [Erysipelothrix urinaevulpis]